MLTNKRMEMDTFLAIRKEILQGWPTGEKIDLQEVVAYQKTIPEYKQFSKRLIQAKNNHETLIQPRAGVALVDEHIELLNYLVEHGGADVLPTTIDSYTRHNRYEEAEKGILESRSAGRSLLNGFPAVNHGVAACRLVNESVKAPNQVRHGTPDARLLAEISIAGGFTSYEGGGISYNIPYAKNHSLEKTLRDWQYCDRLIGFYEEEGVSINREPFGPLTGTLVPPCISTSVAIIESLLAATQGVKNITVGYGQCGNLRQDVAAIRALESLTEAYLMQFGFDDVVVTTVFHQWMGGFPQDESKAYGVISWGAATAALSGATKVIVKTPHEAMGVPTKEANASGLRTTKQMITMLKDQVMPVTRELAEEIDRISEETRAIVDRVIEIGEGDLIQGVIRAFEAGILDIPFAPSKFNRGKMLPARDNEGAVRFLEIGNLPFNQGLKEYHQSKMKERAKVEGRSVSFQMVIDDIYAISKGRLVGRPK